MTVRSLPVFYGCTIRVTSIRSYFGEQKQMKMAENNNDAFSTSTICGIESSSCQQVHNVKKDTYVAVVTGGSNGIGWAIVKALLLLEEGSDTSWKQPIVVIVLDRVPPSDMSHPHLHYIQVDVGDLSAVQNAVSTVLKQHQRLDCWINNAGIFETEENNNVLWNDATTTNAIQQIVAVNLCAVIHSTRWVLQSMRHTPGGGIIINIASTAALDIFPCGHAVYASTKAAVLHFTRTAAYDNPHCRIVCLCPGIIDTEMGRLGGEQNRIAVSKLKGGQRTSPDLVATAILDLIRGKFKGCDYVIVDNHEIRAVYS